MKTQLKVNDWSNGWLTVVVIVFYTIDIILYMNVIIGWRGRWLRMFFGVTRQGGSGDNIQKIANDAAL